VLADAYISDHTEQQQPLKALLPIPRHLLPLLLLHPYPICTQQLL
jgi:hypothetical protein